jgi:hypothetical protein
MSQIPKEHAELIMSHMMEIFKLLPDNHTITMTAPTFQGTIVVPNMPQRSSTITVTKTSVGIMVKSQQGTGH